MQLLLRAMNEGRLGDRDRMLHYTVGEAYQEMSLFLEEAKRQKEQLDKLRK